MFRKAILIATFATMAAVNTASAAEPHSMHYIIDMAGAGQPLPIAQTKPVLAQEENRGENKSVVISPFWLELRHLAIVSRPHN
jgi:hypothetical protein